jgi:hypothetical protein
MKQVGGQGADGQTPNQFLLEESEEVSLLE